jgi:trehalose-6-phosphate synthase
VTHELSANIFSPSVSPPLFAHAQQWNTDELADGIYQAMSMDSETRKANHDKMFKYINKYTAAYWGVSFVNDLVKIKQQDEEAAKAIRARKRKSSAIIVSNSPVYD